MIHYDLRCSQDHDVRRLVQGQCRLRAAGEARPGGVPALRRREGGAGPDAPRGRQARRCRPSAGAGAGAAAATAAGAAVAGGPMPAHMRAMLQQMRAEVEKHCDYVGPQFAEEARKIHRGESDKRGIYGETSPERGRGAGRRRHRGRPHPLGAARRRVVSPRRRGGSSPTRRGWCSSARSAGR